MDTYDDDPRGGGGTSIAAPLIRALLAAAVAFGVYWLVFAADPADDIVLDDPTEDLAALPTVPEEPAATPTATTPVMTTAPTEAATTSPARPGEGTSVQVLNGTDDQALFDDVVATLSDLGYDVTQSGRARQDYSETTIFATAGQEAAADALQVNDPRFTTIGENPGNLTTQIDIHVVVGSDWTTGGATDGADASASEDGTFTDATEVPTDEG